MKEKGYKITIVGLIVVILGILCGGAAIAMHQYHTLGLDRFDAYYPKESALWESISLDENGNKFTYRVNRLGLEDFKRHLDEQRAIIKKATGIEWHDDPDSYGIYINEYIKSHKLPTPANVRALGAAVDAYASIEQGAEEGYRMFAEKALR